MTTIEQPHGMTHDPSTSNLDESPARPWIHLTTTFDVEAWIDQYNWDLQRFMQGRNTTGFGVCFSLDHGGQIYLHTGQDAIWLDVTPEAEWVAPVITAATGVAAPQGQIWSLPDDKLTQLVLGLSSLIASSRMVATHSYRIKKY